MSMKRNFFVFDGKSSLDFNTFVATSTAWDGAVHDEEVIEVPGRNGAIVFSNGRYHNVEANVDCYIPHGMRHNVDSLRAFLSSRHGYCRYEEAIKPDEFRMARFAGPFSLSESDRVGAAFTLVFDCKPQRFLKGGEIPISYSASGTIYNPTEYEAKPLIRCYGTSGAISVGGVWMGVSACDSYIDIDCELMEAFEGNVNRNLNVGGEFPTLKPGQNAVGFSGFSHIEITPRWWRI